MYDQAMVDPMIKELTNLGFESLESADVVTDKLTNMNGTALVVVNSICGCAAGSARPGVIKSLENSIKPEKLYTVFAGQYPEATNTARSFFDGYTPSSPSVALMKDGQVTHMLERTDIEGNDAGNIADQLSFAYNRHCQGIEESTTIEELCDRFPGFADKIKAECGKDSGALSSVDKTTQDLIYAIEDILDAEPEIAPVSFTPEGAIKFKEFREKEGASESGLGLNGQGMGFQESAGPDDLEFDYEGIKIFVDKKSAKRYGGKKIHFSETPQGGGFSLI
jgi:putative YphP/YqiW family bacilliredoxin